MDTCRRHPLAADDTINNETTRYEDHWIGLDLATGWASTNPDAPSAPARRTLMTTRKTDQLTPEEIRNRKIKLAEGGIVFALVFGLCVFLGIHFAGEDGGESVTDATPIADAPPVVVEPVTPAVVASTPPAAADDGTEPVAAVDATGESRAAEEPLPIEVKLPDVPIHVTYSSAEKAYLDGRHGEAADMFARYCEEHPENAWGHYMRGLSLWKADRDTEAVGAFEAALDRKPDHLKSLVNLARVQLELDQPDLALVSIEQALDTAPHNVDARRVLGRVHHELGELDQAVEAFTAALQLKSDDAWSLNNLALVWIEMEQFEQALAPLARAVELAPETAVMRNNLAVALERTGHAAAACEQYELAAIAGSAKGEQSLARLESVTIDPGEASVDLAALAASWSVEPEMADAAVAGADAAGPSSATVAAITGEDDAADDSR
ncbi:tetratricopeptide repeat protein [bacterium]|nr:tetratricopeptide repeat protein [bacterium]